LPAGVWTDEVRRRTAALQQVTGEPRGAVLERIIRSGLVVEERRLLGPRVAVDLDEARSLGAETLRRQLEDEMRHPHENGEPLIIIERPQRHTTHLFVIWASFDGFKQEVRSGLILDAYEAVHGEQAALDVTASMGLTPEEAKRAGIG
jgi:hypothetical protein